MFKSNKPPALPASTDFTSTLRETSFYKYGHLRTLGLGGEVTALAVDPLLSLLAVGTSAGAIHVFGNAAFQFTLPITPPGVRASAGAKGVGVKFLVFHPGHNRLVAIDDGNSIHSFALNDISDAPNPNLHPPLPTREATHTIFGEVTAVEQPLPSYTHMFMTMRDGTILAWDLRQRALSSYQVENLWSQYEERLVRSGVPGRKKTLGGPQARCMAMNPRDLNIMLIGYEGGVVAWDFQAKNVAKTFEMVLPPGAPGGGTYLDDTLWTERRPEVTTVTWRPDGQVFAVGHADGCIAFWAYADSDKPLQVRTLTHEDVNVTDAEALMSAGALDNQLRSQRLDESATHEIEGMPIRPTAVNANREPIFKLSWAGFPDAIQLKLLATQAANSVPLTNATAEYAERGETLLVVLGGQSPSEKPGINMLQLPAYKPPVTPPTKKVVSPSEGLSVHERSAFRDSLAPTGSSNYPTKTPPEDFTLLPRSSPFFGMSHDPVVLFILLTPDPRLPKPDVPIAQRQLEAFVFPPPRSNVEPPVLGRKTYLTPGEGENLVAMTPAPRMDSSFDMSRRPSNSSWRFPWTADSSASSSSVNLVSPALHLNIRRRYRIPSQVWSGGLTMLGCKIISLPTTTFKRLIAHTIDTAGQEKVPRVPLRGGIAVPDLQTHGAPDLKVVKMENYRLLASWHADATVRFWDISPHILCLPTPLKFEYPAALPHLTIPIGRFLRHPDVAHLPLAKLWAKDRTKVQIVGVQLARETLECVVSFKTGEIFVAKFTEARPAPATPTSMRSVHEDEDEAGEDQLYSPSQEYFPPQPKETHIEEITEIGHLASWEEDGFKPTAIFTVRRGEVVSCAVSDIGFIAVAFVEHSLAILDMRGPDVILREGFNEEGKTMKKRKRKGNVQNVPAENSKIGALKWVVSGIGGDSTMRPRLIVCYDKGSTKIYCLNNVLGEWIVDSKPPTFNNESLASPLATFVLDPVSGNELPASPDALATVLEHHDASEGKWTKEAPPHCLWIAASKKTIRVAINYNGERVAKVEFEDEELSDVHYIYRHGKRIIVALTTTGSAIVYTAPHLEFVTRMDLYFGSPRPLGKLSFDDRSGDFIEYSGPLDIALRTLFHFRKPFPPRIDPCILKTPVPPQPVPLTASALGWIWGAGPLTGAALDTLIAGPQRPAAPRPPPAPRKPLITWGDVPAAPVPSPTAATSTAAPKRPPPRKARAPTSDARERRDAYSEVQEGLTKRGDMVDNLSESMMQATESAGNYLQAASKSVFREAGKAGAKSFFKW